MPPGKRQPKINQLPKYFDKLANISSLAGKRLQSQVEEGQDALSNYLKKKGMITPLLDFVTMFGGGGLAGAAIKGTAKKALGQKNFQKTIADKAMKSRAI